MNLIRKNLSIAQLLAELKSGDTRLKTIHIDHNYTYQDLRVVNSIFRGYSE